MTVTLVTGGASGIGRAVAHKAVENGSVAILDRDINAARSTAAEIGENAIPISCDVVEESSVIAAFRNCQETLGTPTKIFACAGIERNAPPHLMSYATWSAVLTTNLDGTFLVCREAIRLLRAASQPGSIVCTSSPAAFVGFAGGGNGAYAASKGGISALVRSLALDCAADGIRVNAVVPGATDTPMMWSQFSPAEREGARAEVAEQAREQIPLGRLAAPDEVAAAVDWLLSAQASYVTGTHLMCDGGLLAKGANTF